MKWGGGGWVVLIESEGYEVKRGRKVLLYLETGSNTSLNQKFKTCIYTRFRTKHFL